MILLGDLPSRRRTSLRYLLSLPRFELKTLLLQFFNVDLSFKTFSVLCLLLHLQQKNTVKESPQLEEHISTTPPFTLVFSLRQLVRLKAHRAANLLGLLLFCFPGGFFYPFQSFSKVTQCKYFFFPRLQEHTNIVFYCCCNNVKARHKPSSSVVTF